MLKHLMTLFILGLTVGVHADSLQSNIDQATGVIRDLRGPRKDRIPKAILDQARGIAVLNLVRVGFVVSGQGGEGIVVAKTSSGWSAPSAIGTGSIGIGLQVGAEATDFLIILNTDHAVDVFAKGGNVSLGLDLGAAIGPTGGTAQTNIVPRPDVYTYSLSKGLFVGASLQGTVIAERSGANAEFYGKPVSAEEILSGDIPQPKSASALYEALNGASHPLASSKAKKGGLIALIIGIGAALFYFIRKKRST